MEEDLEGLQALRDCLNNTNVALTSVDLMHNRIGMYYICCLCIYIVFGAAFRFGV
jgi:hypothetical protein